jgi:hypothetical protein
MKYIVNSGYPIGGFNVPPGTIIDDEKPEHLLTHWEQIARGRLPPRDAHPLDQATYDAMFHAYVHRGNGYQVPPIREMPEPPPAAVPKLTQAELRAVRALMRGER